MREKVRRVEFNHPIFEPILNSFILDRDEDVFLYWDANDGKLEPDVTMWYLNGKYKKKDDTLEYTIDNKIIADKTDLKLDVAAFYKYLREDQRFRIKTKSNKKKFQFLKEIAKKIKPAGFSIRYSIEPKGIDFNLLFNGKISIVTYDNIISNKANEENLNLTKINKPSVPLFSNYLYYKNSLNVFMLRAPSDLKMNIDNVENDIKNKFIERKHNELLEFQCSNNLYFIHELSNRIIQYQDDETKQYRDSLKVCPEFAYNNLEISVRGTKSILKDFYFRTEHQKKRDLRKTQYFSSKLEQITHNAIAKHAEILSIQENNMRIRNEIEKLNDQIEKIKGAKLKILQQVNI